jgi:hypothetical protein
MTDCYYATKDWRACKKEVCQHLSRLVSSGVDLANTDIRWKSSASAGSAMAMKSGLIPKILEALFQPSPPFTTRSKRAYNKVLFPAPIIFYPADGICKMTQCQFRHVQRSGHTCIKNTQCRPSVALLRPFSRVVEA